MATTNKASWTDAGLTLLRDGGQDALTIAALCEALGRTKGAFYHHFENVELYLEATLGAWEARNTLEPIALANLGESARSRRRALDAAVQRLDSRLDLAVRAWGLRDPRARAFVERVDELRIQYLAGLMPPTLSRAAQPCDAA